MLGIHFFALSHICWNALETCDIFSTYIRSCGPNFHHEPKVKSYDIFTKYSYKYLFQTTWQKKNQLVWKKNNMNLD